MTNTTTTRSRSKATTHTAARHAVTSLVAHAPRRVSVEGNGPRVYSYIRFSSAKQAAGTSLERQAHYATEWAEKHGLVLDTSLTMRDLGFSAWKGEHLEKGALGAFIKAIEQGRIAPGSVLVVESLDRLSRAMVEDAMRLLLSITSAGITVVTANDDKEYARGKMEATDLMVSLVFMMRAHEESSTKSDRVQRALRHRCQQWIDGKWRGNLRAGRDPSWVHWNGTSFELVQGHVQTLHAMMKLYAEGYGPRRIADMLEEQGITLPWGLAQEGRFYEVLRNRSLIGERAIKVMGEVLVLPDYYPPVLTVAQFDQLQLMLKGRTRRGGGVKGEIPPLFTGMRMCLCGHCKWAMACQNMASSREEDGTYRDSGRRINCSGAGKPGGCRRDKGMTQSTSVVPIERAVIAFCCEQANLDSLRASSAGAVTLSARIAKAHEEKAAQEEKAANLGEAIAAGGGKQSRTLAALLTATEKKLDTLAGDIATMTREYTALSRSDAAANAKAWAKLVKAVAALDYDARMQMRGLIADTFSSITIYIEGVGGTAPGFVDVELTSRQGVLRMLRIDRSTGEWIAEQNIDTLKPLPRKKK